MNAEEEKVAKNIGEQMSTKILCPRCDSGQTLSAYGDFEDTLFCPRCDLDVQIVVSNLE